MDAPRASGAAWQPHTLSRSSAGIVRAVAVSCFVLLALGGILIAIRRATGALAGPLPAEVLIVCAGTISLAALAFRRMLPLLSHAPLARRVSWALWAAPSGVLLLWAAGLSAGASGGALVGSCGLLLLEESWSWYQLLRNPATIFEMRGASVASARLAPAVSPNVVHGVGIEDSPELEDSPESDDAFDHAVSQQTVRRSEDDGSQTISGWVRAEVAAGCRHATAHVAICPPFVHPPECFAEPMDGPPARVKVAQVLSHGVRFEVKLDEPAAEAARVLVEFSIQERSAAQ
jgi:hypothetical protein